MSAVAETTVTIATALLRRIALIVGGAVLLSLATGLAYYWFKYIRLEDRNAVLEERITMAETRAEAAAVALIASEAERLQAEKAVEFQTSENESIRDELRGLQQKTVEVVRNDPNSGTRIPSAVADSLRMQHKTANRYAVRSHTGDASPVNYTGAENTASARRNGG